MNFRFSIGDFQLLLCYRVPEIRIRPEAPSAKVERVVLFPFNDATAVEQGETTAVSDPRAVLSHNRSGLQREKV